MREEKLFLFLLRWVRAEPTRDQYLVELSRNIIFALMDAAFLQKHVLTSPALKLSKEDVTQEQLLVFGGDSSSSTYTCSPQGNYRYYPLLFFSVLSDYLSISWLQ